MLPNHSPLVIAEQFGTLETLHPGRIDLGLGRAPGSDTAAMRALRRDEFSSERFPQDVQELQGLLSDNSPISGVIAIPGKGTYVPLYILGCSLFGAQLAAVLGLPYAFASHFAPHSLFDALQIYRENFKPSAQLAEPYAIAGVGVIAAADKESAEAQLEITRRSRVKNLFKSPSGGKLNDGEVDEVLDSPRAKVVDEMLTYSAVGTGAEAAAYLADFQEKTGAQELITVHYADSVDNRVKLGRAAGRGGGPDRGRRSPPRPRAGGRRLRRGCRGRRSRPRVSASGWVVRKATTGMPAARPDGDPGAARPRGRGSGPGRRRAPRRRAGTVPGRACRG